MVGCCRVWSRLEGLKQLEREGFKQPKGEGVGDGLPEATAGLLVLMAGFTEQLGP